MKKHALGRTNVEVTEIGLGTWEISGDVWGKKDDSESIRAIHTALDDGVNYIDTAAGYGSGHSEILIGNALKQWKGKGKDVVISTKILPKCLVWAPSPDKPIDDFFPPDWIVEQCEKSLRNLQAEKIDILFFHTWSPSWGHRTEWFETMDKLKKSGKIRAIGISIPDERIADANVHIEGGRVDVIQCVYNIFQQEPEYTLFPLAQKHKVGIVARSPFSSGPLTGDWSEDMSFPEGDWRPRWPAGAGYPNWVKDQANMLNAIKPVANAEGLPFNVFALRYVLMNSTVTTTIPGSANPAHVRANVSAASTRPLKNETINELKKLWLEGKIHGIYNGSI